MILHRRFPEMLARRSELTGAEEVTLQEHLASCPDCRMRASAYAEQTALLRAIPVVEPPPGLRAAVLDSVHRAPPAPRRAFPRLLALAPLAAMALVIAAVAFLNRPQSHRPLAITRQATLTPAPQTAAPAPGLAVATPRGVKRHPSPHGRATPNAHPGAPATPSSNSSQPLVVSQLPLTVPPASSPPAAPSAPLHHPGQGTAGAPATHPSVSHPPTRQPGPAPTAPSGPPQVAAVNTPPPTVAAPLPPSAPTQPPGPPVGVAGIQPTPLPQPTTPASPPPPPPPATPAQAFAPAPAPLPTPTATP